MSTQPFATADSAHGVVTSELTSRSAKQPDYRTENIAIEALLKEMAVSPGSIFQKLVETALQLCGAGTAGLSLLDVSGAEPVFRWPALAGQHAAYIGGTMPRYASPCGIVVDEGLPQLFSKLGKYYPQLNVQPPFEEALLLPFFVNDQPVGTLWVVATDNKRHFDAEDVRIMGNLAAIASSAIQMQQLSSSEQAREALQLLVSERTAQLDGANRQLAARVMVGDELAEHRRTQLQETAMRLEHCEHVERQKLAHILHDDLQQLLVAAQLNLSLVLRQAKGTPAEEAALRAAELVKQSIASSRTLTTELSPIGMHDGNLAAALNWLAGSMHEKHGITVAVEADQSTHQASEPVKRLMVQAVRELLFNIVKHAKVLEARVEAMCDGGQTLRIIVEDHGAGFNPQVRLAAAEKGGFGLNSIRERLEAVGGGMMIESHEGRGTRTTLWAP